MIIPLTVRAEELEEGHLGHELFAIGAFLRGVELVYANHNVAQRPSLRKLQIVTKC